MESGKSAIQNRIDQINTTKQAILTHCMCFDFAENKTHYQVIFPIGFYPEGIKAAKNIGKNDALKKMLDFMEKTWVESYPAQNQK